MGTRHQLTNALSNLEFWCAERSRDPDVKKEFAEEMMRTSKGLRDLLAALSPPIKQVQPTATSAGVEVNCEGF